MTPYRRSPLVLAGYGLLLAALLLLFAREPWGALAACGAAVGLAAGEIVLQLRRHRAPGRGQGRGQGRAR
ncbi:MAG: hypothetical protein ACREMN_05065 [Gemmatimonadales bacterium]